MKKNLFILFILVSMLFPGCENELPYMNKPQVPQLLMNAFLEAGKEENGVSLRMIDTDKQQADCVSNGSIVVYVNGQKTETAEVEKVYGSFDDSNCTLKTSFVLVTVSALKRQPKTGNTRLVARWKSLFRSRKLSV